ncbi:NUDIX domain-containing protein [Candidatus Woesearchaeota archaeon]|nr:NUDIX domain-containing protein [Candidatus Woesearchaeota archaeon]
MTEWVDVVNKRDRRTGKLSRTECHEQGLLHRQVHVVVVKNSCFLVVKRSKSKDVYPGFFEIGISGHVQTGESYSEAARRELREELGIRSGKLRRLGKCLIKTGDISFFAFYVLEYAGRIFLDKKEASTAIWAKKLPKRVTSATKAAMRLFKLR